MITTEEIYEQMCRDFADSTGITINDDSEMAVRMQAAAYQIHSLYAYSDWALRQCFPQTAQDEQLDRLAQVWGISRKGAEKAVGTVRFSLTDTAAAAVLVPAGTVCASLSGEEFITLADGVIAPGERFADVAAEAMEPGSAGNAAENTVVLLTDAPVGVSGCTNPQRFTGGTDGETDDALRARVLALSTGMFNSANAAFYEALTLDTDGVGAVSVLPKNRGAGTVDVVIASNIGMPGSELLAQVQAKLDEARELCADVQVIAPRPVPVTVRARVAVKTGWSETEVLRNVEDLLYDSFSGRRLGRDLIRAELIAAIFAVDGVKNVELESPQADIQVEKDVLLRLSSIHVSGWNA